jgi:hypothetical protein
MVEELFDKHRASFPCLSQDATRVLAVRPPRISPIGAPRGLTTGDGIHKISVL